MRFLARLRDVDQDDPMSSLGGTGLSSIQTDPHTVVRGHGISSVSGGLAFGEMDEWTVERVSVEDVQNDFEMVGS